jgi:hypothetical protein
MPGRSKSSSKQPSSLAVACGLVWHRVGHILPFCLVCQRNASAIPLRCVGPLRVWHGHHYQVRQASSALHLPWFISYLPRAMAERRDGCHQHLKSTVMLFTKAERLFPKPSPVQLFREPFHRVNTSLYLGVTLCTRLTWWIEGEQVNLAPSGGPPPAPTLGSCWCFNPSDFALLLVHLGTLITGKFTRIWSSILRRPHQSSNREFRFQFCWCVRLVISTTRQIITQTEVWPRSLEEQTKSDWVEQASRDRPLNGGQVDTTNRASALLFGSFWLLWLRFFRDFFSILRRMPGYNSKTVCARPALSLRHCGFTKMSAQSRMTPACDAPTVGSKLSETPSQRFSPDKIILITIIKIILKN